MTNGKRIQVKFYKDGDHMAVETTHTESSDFLDDVAWQLAGMAENRVFEGNWAFPLCHWLPQIVEIACKLRGYKADVEVEQIVRSGCITPRPCDVVWPLEAKVIAEDHEATTPREVEQ